MQREKLKALIHYIAYKAPNSLLGKIKLNKILWFSERDFYLIHGRTITGESYKKFERGPASEHLLEILGELTKERKIVTRKSRIPTDYEKHEYISLDRPNIDIFSPEEISIVDDYIRTICYEHTATSISDLSHDEAWSSFRINDTIPFEACLSRKGELREQDQEWIDAQVREIEKKENGCRDEGQA